MTTDVAAAGRRSEAARRPPGRRVLRGIGWTFIAIGIVLVLFVVYQLFVTNLITDRYQGDLRGDLDRQFAAVEETGVPRPPRPIPGEALAVLRIPKIEVNMAVIEGVGVEDLKRGPGHYPGTPIPGKSGNVGIAGHRTTYGKPFWSLDRLRRGDRVFLRTRQGTFRYEVVWQRVVDPSDRSVLDPTPHPTLTLTTCNPRFSAAQRLIVRARLVQAPPGVEIA